MSVTLKWCPPYLWTGHHIKYYTVSITNKTDGTVTYNHINATFSDSVVAFEMKHQHYECTEFVFLLFAVSGDDVHLQSYEVTGGYQQG